MDKDFEAFVKTLPKNQRSTEDFDLYRFWELNDKPKDFKEAVKKRMYIIGEDAHWHANSATENKDTGEIEVLKKRNHPNLWMETMQWDLNSDLHKTYILNQRDNKFYYTPRKQNGGKLNYLNFFKI